MTASVNALAVRLRSPSSILIVTVVFNNMLRIVNSVILTRVLGPTELGLAAVIQSIFFALALMSDAGFQPFVVRHDRGDEPHFLDVIWTAHVARGVGLWLTGVAIGAIIYATSEVPALGLLLGCAALTFAIEGAASPSLYTALRTGGVRMLSLIDVIILVVQFAITIGAAFIFFNAWAIVIGMIVCSLTRAILSFALFADSARRFRYDPAILAELWKFSRVIASSSMLTLVLAQIDKLLLASFISVAAFGIYATAANLAAAPQTLAHNYAIRIVFPNLSRAWRAGPDGMKAHYYAGQGMVFFGFLFAAGVLIGGASTVVDLLYDDRFAMAGVYLSLLAVPTAMLMITRSASECLVAMGRPAIVLEMNIGRMIWLGVIGPIAFFGGGLFAFLGVLASVELPAYMWGAYRLHQAQLLIVRRESFAFATILAGIAFGFGSNLVYGDYLKPLMTSEARSIARGARS